MTATLASPPVPKALRELLLEHDTTAQETDDMLKYTVESFLDVVEKCPHEAHRDKRMKCPDQAEHNEYLAVAERIIKVSVPQLRRHQELIAVARKAAEEGNLLECAKALEQATTFMVPPEIPPSALRAASLTEQWKNVTNQWNMFRKNARITLSKMGTPKSSASAKSKGR
jgi:hypothetical protein